MTTKEMKNANIGTLGERFIQARLDVGMSFDDAWNEWEILHKELLFILVDCPEVQSYDWWGGTCRAEFRLGLRLRAKKAFGKHMRSEDVSRLARVGSALKCAIPKPRYEMDESVVRELLSKVADEFEIEGDVETAMVGRSDELVEQYKTQIEEFANQHSLWAVPPKSIWKLWARSNLETNKDTDE
jgi:hypothetical protein